MSADSRRCLGFAILAALVLSVGQSPPASMFGQDPPMPGPGPVVVPDDPKPLPEPKPTPVVPEVKTGIVIPARSDDHSLIRCVSILPAQHAGDDRVWRFWEVGSEGWQRLTKAVQVEPLDGCQSQLILTAKPGSYLAECLAAGGPYTAPFVVGDPPPPEPAKPLSELAGKDAAALSAVYTELAAAADDFELVSVFNSVAAAALKPYEANPALPVIAARLQAVLGSDGAAKVDAEKLRAELLQVVKEIGAPPPTPDNELARLVPSAEHREALAGMYESLASAVHAGGITTLGQFRSEHLEQAKSLGIKGIAGINKIISDRLAAAVGLEDAPLDADKAKRLTDALNQIAADFRGGK